MDLMGIKLHRDAPTLIQPTPADIRAFRALHPLQQARPTDTPEALLIWANRAASDLARRDDDPRRERHHVMAAINTMLDVAERLPAVIHQHSRSARIYDIASRDVDWVGQRMAEIDERIHTERPQDWSAYGWLLSDAIQHSQGALELVMAPVGGA